MKQGLLAQGLDLRSGHTIFVDIELVGLDDRMNKGYVVENLLIEDTTLILIIDERFVTIH